MFKNWRLFGLIIDEVEKSLAFVDMDVMRGYADLLTEAAIKEKFYLKIVREYELSVEKYFSLPARQNRVNVFPASAGNWNVAAIFSNQSDWPRLNWSNASANRANRQTWLHCCFP